MTVCVGVAVNDCLVFAADSAATLVSTDPVSGESRIVNVYKHGYKVFNLYKRLPLVGMTCGMGNIGTSSIGTLAKNLRLRLMSDDPNWRVDPVNYTVEEVVTKARRYLFDERFWALNPPPKAPHSLEFWVGGYGSDFDAPHEVWKIAIINGDCADPDQVIKNGDTGLFVGGQPTPVNRLVVGFDSGLIDALIGAGADPNFNGGLERFLREKTELSLVIPTMPIQDAIDLVTFLAETTKQFFRFLPGADIVGGDTDVAVVTKYEGFKWIRRKHFYMSSLNPLETDHAGPR